MSLSSKKIASIEFGRVLAIFAILAMHCQMFLTYFQVDDVPWFGYIFNQATRFAVPLFFVISGYLIQPKLVAEPISTLKQYCKPLARIFVVWSAICLAMPFNLNTVMESGYLAERQGYWGYLAQTPLNSLLEGGLVHLWFIPALMIAVAVLAYLVRSGQEKLILPVALGLYVYGVLAGSYQTITDLDAPFFTRNGPFFSTLMVAIGFTIRSKSLVVSPPKAACITLVGMAIHFGEAFWLYGYDQAFNANDFLFGTAIWGMGLFLLLLAKPNLGNVSWIQNLSKSVLPIYVSHLPVIIIMMNITGALQLGGGVKDFTILTGTIILTLLLVKGLEKTPLSKWVFR